MSLPDYISYRIVYPSGDKTRLALAEVELDEEADWSLASSRVFTLNPEGYRACIDHLLYLAERFKLLVQLPQLLD